MAPDFEILSAITEHELIAEGTGVRDRVRLNRLYGRARWRKMKGIAQVKTSSGDVRLAELHWYEAHGLGKREIKRKRYLD